MGCEIQWLKEKDGETGVFRCGDGFDKFGDPYEMVCTVQRLPDDVLHMFGVQSSLKKLELVKYLPSIRELMRREGVKHIIWERLKNGRIEKVKIDIKGVE